MSGEPIKAGDRCEVVDGLKGKDSPNLGMVVIVLRYVGDHSKYGRIWNCEAEFVERGQAGNGRAPPGTADFAQKWLRKLPPDPATPQGAKADKGVTA